MNCEEFLSLLPMYPDAMPSAQAAAEFRMHAAECGDCAARLSEHELMISSLQALDDGLNVPEEFSAGWRAAIQNEAAPKRASRLRGFRGWAYAAAACALVMAGTAMMQNGMLFPSAGPDKQQTVYSMDVAGTPVPYAAKRSFDSGAPAAMTEEAVSESIVLHSAALQLSSARYDEDVEQIDRLLTETGGWSEYWSVTGEPIETNPESGRYASMTLRIPMETLYSFIDTISQIGTLTGSEITAEDISGSYYDVQGRLHMYEAQRDRLTELLAQADSMADILDIESRLSEVQFSIETLIGRLNSWNSRADNAVVRITVVEVMDGGRVSQGDGLWGRIQSAFSDSFRGTISFLKDALVFLVMASPTLAIAAIVTLVIIAIVKTRKRHGKPQRSKEE